MRTVFKLTGADIRSFLQGLITNDIAKIDHGLVYTAMLTPQGKFLADFFLSKDADGILLDVDSAYATPLQTRLNMYKLRADVTISDTTLTVSRGTASAPDGALSDPRHPSLGWRLYTAGPLQTDTADWTALNIAASIPTAGVELHADSFILENGFETINGVDFKKGCYVGQEVTARMKHKTELRKGLARVNITGSAPIGTDIQTADGKSAGTLYSQSNGTALAYLRFDRAQGPLTAGQATLSYPAK